MEIGDCLYSVVLVYVYLPTTKKLRILPMFFSDNHMGTVCKTYTMSLCP